jgi:nitrite transporter NirC
VVTETVASLAETAQQKTKLWMAHPAVAFVYAAMAGLFIGLGIALIFAVGAPFAEAHSPALKLVMGTSFGIALSLVIFAGSDLFTSNTMTLPLAAVRGLVPPGQAVLVIMASWLGNLAGAWVLALLVWGSGVLDNAGGLLQKYATIKMGVAPGTLFLKAILCNLLVCLAVWTSARTTNDAAKLILIWWCLFGFIGTGYEHSIANMSLLALVVLTGNGDPYGWAGYWYNLGWVTAGNLVAGVVFMAAPYAWVARAESLTSSEIPARPSRRRREYL